MSRSLVFHLWSFFLLSDKAVEFASVSFGRCVSPPKIFVCFVPVVTFSRSPLPSLDKKRQGRQDAIASDSPDARVLKDMRHLEPQIVLPSHVPLNIRARYV